MFLILSMKKLSCREGKTQFREQIRTGGRGRSSPEPGMMMMLFMCRPVTSPCCYFEAVVFTASVRVQVIEQGGTSCNGASRLQRCFLCL